MTDLDDPLDWTLEIPDTEYTRAAYARGYRMGLTRGAIDAYYGRPELTQADLAPKPPRWRLILRTVDEFTRDHMGLILAVWLVAAFVVILVAP